MPLEDNTKPAQCQTPMNDIIIYALCGISAALSIASIIISVRGRRNNGRDEKKDDHLDGG